MLRTIPIAAILPLTLAVATQATAQAYNRDPLVARQACISDALVRSASLRQADISRHVDSLLTHTRATTPIARSESTLRQERRRLLDDNMVNLAIVNEGIAEGVYLIYYIDFAKASNRMYAALDSASNHSNTEAQAAEYRRMADHARGSVFRLSGDHPSVLSDHREDFQRMIANPEICNFTPTDR